MMLSRCTSVMSIQAILSCFLSCQMYASLIVWDVTREGRRMLIQVIARQKEKIKMAVVFGSLLQSFPHFLQKMKSRLYVKWI